jgi:uncharacterized phage protein (TIGR01671 family)
MREIEFRGKYKDKWRYGYLCRDNIFDCYIIQENKPVKCNVSWNINPETVGQFTGLLDKNGVKVFEGDILKVLHFISGKRKNYLYHLIRWEDKNFEFRAVNLGELNEEVKQGSPPLCVYNRKSFEVIGNIHDNPELLEVQND